MYSDRGATLLIPSPSAAIAPSGPLGRWKNRCRPGTPRPPDRSKGGARRNRSPVERTPQESARPRRLGSGHRPTGRLSRPRSRHRHRTPRPRPAWNRRKRCLRVRSVGRSSGSPPRWLPSVPGSRNAPREAVAEPRDRSSWCRCRVRRAWIQCQASRTVLERQEPANHPPDHAATRLGTVAIAATITSQTTNSFLAAAPDESASGQKSTKKHLRFIIS